MLMKAIITRFHGPTNYRGSRIAACAEGVQRLYLPYDHSLSPDENHYAAAYALAQRQGWLQPGHTLAGGGLPNGRGNAYVFVQAPAAVNE